MYTPGTNDKRNKIKWSAWLHTSAVVKFARLLGDICWALATRAARPEPKFQGNGLYAKELEKP